MYVPDVSVLFFSNTNPDVVVAEVPDCADWRSVATEFFSDKHNVVEVVMRNNHPHPVVRSMCPFLRIVVSRFGGRMPVNHHLLRFCRVVGANDMNYVRCEEAVVFGCKGEKLLSIPVDMQLTWASDFVKPVLESCEKEKDVISSSMRLMCACEECASSNVKCDQYIGCSRCDRSGMLCRPSSMEYKRHAGEVFRAVNAGEAPHDDHVAWQLYLQYCHYQPYGVKPPTFTLTKCNQARLADRLSEQWGGVALPVVSGGTLPYNIERFIAGKACYKVERMIDGVYMMETSDAYGRNICDEAIVMKRMKAYKLLPKLVDTCNLEYRGMAYHMWVNSVRAPGCVHSYEGKVFWSGVNRVYVTKVEVMSVVLYMDCIITATVLSF